MITDCNDVTSINVNMAAVGSNLGSYMLPKRKYMI